MPIVFERAPAALDAAIAIQQAMRAASWPGGRDARLRIGVAAHGGQIVLSAAVRSAVTDSLEEAIGLRDLGAWRFHGLPEPIKLFHVQAAGLPSDFPQLRPRGRYLTGLDTSDALRLAALRVAATADAGMGAPPGIISPTTATSRGESCTGAATQLTLGRRDRCP